MLTREQYDELMEITMAADPYDGAIRNLFTAFLDGLSELAATKAPINGSWGDGQFAAGVGSAGEAPTPEHPYLWVNTTPTPPALELRDGTGALINTMAREIPLARQDHASYVALRPNAAWAVAVAGATGTLKLVQLLATNLAASADKVCQISADGGATAHLEFAIPAGAGTYSLGGFVVDHDDVDLAVKSLSDANLSFRAVVMNAPPGVGRLSGVSAGGLFVAAPIYSGTLATLHTAVGAQSVALYAARAAGNAGTKWLGIYGATTAGADTQLGRWSLDEDAPPIYLGQFALNNGEALKVGAEAASQFNVYGYAMSEA